MLKNFLLLIIVAISMAACGQSPADNTQDTGEPQTFGEAITADGAVAFADMLPNLEGVDSMPAKVKGKVTNVCQVKGCWMNITDEATGNNMFVQFKDYGFFMPKDIAGREVIMDGYAYREVTSVDELRHYAEDEGKSKEEIEAITEPKEEMKFMASGVILLPEEKK